MNKRQFVKAAAVFMAGTVISKNRGLGNYGAAVTGAGINNKPIRRELGKTGIVLPIVSSGIIPQENPNLIRAIFDTGIQYFDSAWDYQNGRNDTMVGEMVRKLGREKFIVSTKVLLPMDEVAGQYTKEATTKAFMDQLDISLKRMKLDTVDFLYLHKPPTRNALFNENMMRTSISSSRTKKKPCTGNYKLLITGDALKFRN